MNIRKAYSMLPVCYEEKAVSERMWLSLPFAEPLLFRTLPPAGKNSGNFTFTHAACLISPYPNQKAKFRQEGR